MKQCTGSQETVPASPQAAHSQSQAVRPSQTSVTEELQLLGHVTECKISRKLTKFDWINFLGEVTDH
ncbi:hypothetical protein Pmani_003140 [Petrolisthes manimaculis]|uniref:Uncharacterized protein n=1 Tax=Petrolisthes manimaculis TaxID=1843537 RepID=A0AAE1QH90_9EUCA|nr:hypothetical protein Pmani_003140 [Petrolisthes manimaculis]